MKRDMDLVREMLMVVEGHPNGLSAPDDFDLSPYTPQQIGYHAVLLVEAGLVAGEDATGMGGSEPRAYIHRLTWDGHEFLASARDSQTWNQAKTIVGKIGDAALSVWVAVLAEVAKRQLLT